jgi:hypothetical protein
MNILVICSDSLEGKTFTRKLEMVEGSVIRMKCELKDCWLLSIDYFNSQIYAIL